MSEKPPPASREHTYSIPSKQAGMSDSRPVLNVVRRELGGRIFPAWFIRLPLHLSRRFANGLKLTHMRLQIIETVETIVGPEETTELLSH